MVGGPGLIVMVRLWLPVPVTFVALIVPLYGPAVVGVPVNFPVDVLKLTPGMDTVVLKLVGLLVAVIWYNGDEVV
jgi:hypothetical protein